MPAVSLSDLLESGVHFGHQTRRWNPKMDEYIFTSRNGVHIIDLVQTATLLEEAYQYVRKSAESGKSFLFVGTKRQAAGIVAGRSRPLWFLLRKPALVRRNAHQLDHH